MELELIRPVEITEIIGTRSRHGRDVYDLGLSVSEPTSHVRILPLMSLPYDWAKEDQ